jgi:energy-converting hydrogenase Eha subunit G
VSEVIGYIFWVIGFLIQFVMWTLCIYMALVLAYILIEALLSFVGYKLTIQKE